MTSPPYSRGQVTPPSIYAHRDSKSRREKHPSASYPRTNDHRKRDFEHDYTSNLILRIAWVRRSPIMTRVANVTPRACSVASPRRTLSELSQLEPAGFHPKILPRSPAVAFLKLYVRYRHLAVKCPPLPTGKNRIKFRGPGFPHTSPEQT